MEPGTAQSKGWDTLNNGALLNAAEDAGFELPSRGYINATLSSKSLCPAV